MQCESCSRLASSPIIAWMSLVGQAIDGGALDDAANAARALRRYGVEVRLLPSRCRFVARRRAVRIAKGGGDE